DRRISHPDTAKNEPGDLLDQLGGRPVIGYRRPARQPGERNHCSDMLAKPETIGGGDRSGLQIAGQHCCFDRSSKQRMNPLEDPIEQLPRVFAILEKALKDEAKTGYRARPYRPRPCRAKNTAP